MADEVPILSRPRRTFWAILEAWAVASPLVSSSLRPLIPVEPEATPSNRHFSVSRLQVLYSLGGFSGGNKA